MTENAQIRELAGAIARDCDVDSTCVLVTDKSTPRTNLYFLGNFGVREEVLSQYHDHGICDLDPYTDVERFETGAPASSLFTAASHPQVAGAKNRAANYWRFVSTADIEVVGAATTRLQPTNGVTSTRWRRRCIFP